MGCGRRKRGKVMEADAGEHGAQSKEKAEGKSPRADD